MIESVFERALPSSIEAERCVLGCVMMNSDLIPILIADGLKDMDFFLDSHRRIWRAFVGMYSKKLGIDPVTLGDYLKTKGDLDFIGGPAYIGQLIDFQGVRTGIDEYVRIVKGKAAIRGLISFGNWIVNAGFDQELSAEEIYNLIGSELQKKRSGQQDGIIYGSNLADQVFNEIALARTNPGRATGILTGLKCWDDSLNGIEEASLYTVAGYSSLGKTTLVLQIARNALFGYQEIKAPIIPIYLTLEMPAKRLHYKLLQTETGLGIRNMKRGLLSDEEFRAVGEASLRLADVEIAYCERTNMLANQLSTLIDKVKGRHGNQVRSFVVVDTLQLMPGRDKESEYGRIRQASRDLKNLTNDTGVPVIQLSQLTTPETKNFDLSQEPNENMMRGARDIFMDTDVSVFIHCPTGNKNDQERQLIKKKDRDGEPIAYWDVRFIGRESRFEEYGS